MIRTCALAPLEFFKEINHGFMFVETAWCSNKKYLKNIKETESDLIILDNSTHLFGRPLSNKRLLSIAGILRCVKEVTNRVVNIILPDVKSNYRATVKLVDEFTDKAWDKGKDHSELIPVIQGDSVKELDDCLDKYFNMGFSRIAIPYKVPAKDILGSYMSMSGLIELLKEKAKYPDLIAHPYQEQAEAIARTIWINLRQDRLKNMKVHLLGLSDSLELLWHNILGHEMIESNDSSMAYTFAVKNCEPVKGMKYDMLKGLGDFPLKERHKGFNLFEGGRDAVYSEVMNQYWYNAECIRLLGEGEL